MSNDLAILLARTYLQIPFDQFLKEVKTQYPRLGEITQFQPITEGYEDANILLVTETGTYVIKIFSKDRSEENVRSYIHILEEAQKIGVPVTRLVPGTKGSISFAAENTKTPYCIAEFFDGNDFQENSPTRDDMVGVASYLAKLNTLRFPMTEYYDYWGNKNLAVEYEKNKESLTREQAELIAPVVESFKKLDFSKFSTSIIHGDMQRKHVLKNAKGE